MRRNLLLYAIQGRRCSRKKSITHAHAVGLRSTKCCRRPLEEDVAADGRSLVPALAAGSCQPLLLKLRAELRFHDIMDLRQMLLQAADVALRPQHRATGLRKELVERPLWLQTGNKLVGREPSTVLARGVARRDHCASLHQRAHWPGKWFT